MAEISPMQLVALVLWAVFMTCLWWWECSRPGADEQRIMAAIATLRDEERKQRRLLLCFHNHWDPVVERNNLLAVLGRAGPSLVLVGTEALGERLRAAAAHVGLDITRHRLMVCTSLDRLNNVVGRVDIVADSVTLMRWLGRAIHTSELVRGQLLDDGEAIMPDPVNVEKGNKGASRFLPTGVFTSREEEEAS